MTRLDEVLAGMVVDAFVLDVEGSELIAWQGAEQIIETHHPMLWFESIHSRADEMASFLKAHDYQPPMHAMHSDSYSIHRSRVT
jgi:hypothetical protein